MSMTLNREYETPTLDPDKFKRLVHYVCFRAPDPRLLGSTKLNKILFYSDMEAYIQLGTPITGEVYLKQKFGPVSKHILPTLEELENENAIAIAEASGYYVYQGMHYQQRRYYSLRRPDIRVFTAEEISIVDQIVEVICTQHTAESISTFSHDVIWEAAEIGEVIPYFTSFSRLLDAPTYDDLMWAKEQIALRT